MDARHPRRPCAREPAQPRQHRPLLALAAAADPRWHALRPAHGLRMAASATGLPVPERPASPVSAPVARRWVIERTFGWIARCRRLARDHEATPSSALAFFVLAAAMILVRRLARAF